MSDLERIDNEIKYLELQIENARLRRRIYELTHAKTPTPKPAIDNEQRAREYLVLHPGAPVREIARECKVSIRQALNAKKPREIPALADSIPGFSYDVHSDGTVSLR